ncbi:MAG: hypothetical protein KC621_06830 [Myxococcales bacterium]|nr:hypothetical protein [Myxococcales bacterium]
MVTVLVGGIAGGLLALVWLRLLLMDARAFAEGRARAGVLLAVARWLLVVGVLMGLVQLGGAAAVLSAMVVLIAVRTVAVPRMAKLL